MGVVQPVQVSITSCNTSSRSCTCKWVGVTATEGSVHCARLDGFTALPEKLQPWTCNIVKEEQSCPSLVWVSEHSHGDREHIYVLVCGLFTAVFLPSVLLYGVWLAYHTFGLITILLSQVG